MSREKPTVILCVCVCVCVCVCFLPIHSGHQVRCTYQPGSHRIFYPPSFCGACLNFVARRIQPFLSLVDREVEFCALTLIAMQVIKIKLWIAVFSSSRTGPISPYTRSIQVYIQNSSIHVTFYETKETPHKRRYMILDTNFDMFTKCLQGIVVWPNWF